MSLPVNDTFTRADETPIGGNYTHIPGGTVTINLATNALISATAANGEGAYFWNADTFANDQWASLDATTASAASGYAIGVNLRADPTGAARTHYYLNANGPGAAGSAITRRLAGVKTVLNSEAATDWGAAPFTVYAEVIGSVLNLRQGGSSGSIVNTKDDTGGITSGNPGPFMFVVNSSEFSGLIADNFKADNLVTAVIEPSLPRAAFQAIKRGAYF